MSDVSSLSISLPNATTQAEANAAPLDLTVPHAFGFAKQRWFTGAGSLVKGGLMAVTGTFLFTQMSSTPNLVVQIAIVGGLLVLAGSAFIMASLGDFFGRVQLDSKAFRVSYGVYGRTIPWTRVSDWRVNEAALKNTGLNSVVLKLSQPEGECTVPGGYLSADDQHLVRRLLHAFAEGKESGKLA